VSINKPKITDRLSNGFPRRLIDMLRRQRLNARLVAHRSNPENRNYRIAGEAGFTGFYPDCFVPYNDETLHVICVLLP
jgi:hypothetical protein